MRTREEAAKAAIQSNDIELFRHVMYGLSFDERMNQEQQAKYFEQHGGIDRDAFRKLCREAYPLEIADGSRVEWREQS